MKTYRLTDWLPTTKKEMEIRGWDCLDVILFSGDAYVDHPSFGAAVIWAYTRSRRAACGDCSATRLARRLSGFQEIRYPQVVLWSLSGGDGFDGQSLYGEQTFA